MVLGAGLQILPLVPPPQARAASNDDAEIVYLDPQGVIRTYDPRPLGPTLAVQWASPDGGWSAIALGDVNGDEDSEIVAVRPEAGGGRLTVFDPVVVNVPEGHSRFVEGIAWDELFTELLPGPPTLLATCEMDASRTGPEIVLVAVIPEIERVRGNTHRLTVLRQSDAAADGRAWEEQTTWDTPRPWSRIDCGNLDAAGSDEIVLVDETVDDSLLNVYRIGDGLAEIFSHRTKENEWRDAAFGQFVAGGGEELAAVREEAPVGAITLWDFWLFQYNGTTLADLTGEYFNPGLRRVFFADITGNGDQEVVMLRHVPQEAGVRPRLIIRDNNNETISMREALLDGDNGYNGGAAGDIDGDGRDEIVLVRDIRIRIFSEPERSDLHEETYTLTNGRDVAVGNLDAAGLARFPRLGATEDAIELSLLAGTVSDVVQVTVADVTTGSGLPVSVEVAGGSTWAVVQPVGTETPVRMNVSFSAAGMQPGEYTDQIVVSTSTSMVLNAPLVIPLTLHVESGVTVTPTQVAVSFYPCTDDLPVRRRRIAVTGPETVELGARIASNPAWATVQPAAGTLPVTVTVTVDPQARPEGDDWVRADLRLELNFPASTVLVERVPVSLLCVRSRVMLPIVAASSSD